MGAIVLFLGLGGSPSMQLATAANHPVRALEGFFTPATYFGKSAIHGVL